ncbi:hypothetical protein N8Z33_03250 [Flavobacteriaceae bacterium]|nr:hypothetical protein [Flavobacteriaceae bacterium]
MKRILFLLFLCVAVHSLSAQRGIGTNSPDPSAILDLTSTTQGFLPPRMTYAQMTAIVSPTAGLTVYCTDCEPVGVHYYDGSFFLHTQTGATSGNLGALDDTLVSFTGTSTLNLGVNYTLADGISASIPYTGWGGNAHNPIAFNSTNAWGMTATLDPASLTASTGNAIFNITGTPSFRGESPIIFDINLGGVSATFSLTTTSLSTGPYGPEELILIQQNSSGFENYNGSNFALYNSRQSNGSFASLFNGNAETGASSFHADINNSGQDWGIGYSFNTLYYFTRARLLVRPDCCEQRSGGGEFRIYNGGVLVATSPIITVTGADIYTSSFAPNIIGDEVRYIFPNGKNTDFGDGTLNNVEFEIFGKQVR